MTDDVKKELIVRWKDFWQYCDRITKAIEQTDKSYTQIIAIARGGFYLGDYLSRRLQIPLSVITASSYDKENKQRELSLGKLSYTYAPHDRMLLVDDLLDTGKTMIAVKKQLEADWNVEIDTAVIWQKTKCPYRATYYCTIIADDYWIVQPFEPI